MQSRLVMALPFLFFILASDVRAVDTTQIRVATGKGVQFLQNEYENLRGPKRTLAALAMYKAGLPADSPQVQEAVKEILKRCEGESYRAGGEHIYEAGVDATFLADLDPERYQSELTKIRDYLIGELRPVGAWDYPQGRDDTDGDTSVTQYGCLGLWAIARAGVEIDPQVWVKILEWHVRFQNKDGGFAYVPGLSKYGPYRDVSTLNMSVNAVGNVHIAILHLNPTFMPLKDDRPKEERSKEQPEAEKAKFGVLKQVDLDKPVRKTTSSARIPPGTVECVRRAYNYVSTRFRAENKESFHAGYYYYSLERMAALADIEQIGDRNWFDECAEFLISRQQDDGKWSLSQHLDDIHDTCFAVLFLTRSTGRLLRRSAEPTVGGGLLAGGRGLPDDLSDVEFDGTTVKGKEAPKEPFDKLLASLSNTGDIDFSEVQEQIVEQVQLGDRSELIGQIDRLLELVDHPDAKVRQTVVWAIGRTGDMALAQHLINALNDKDIGVMIEAQNALCWLSRKPLGFGLPRDPLAELDDDATEQQKRDAVTAWHKQAVLSWGRWYLENRPFDDRGDEFEAILRARMDRLREGVAVR
jgi:hypothetical protein